MEEPELASVGAPVKVLAKELKGHGVAWHAPADLRPRALRTSGSRRRGCNLWPRLDVLFQSKGRAFIHCYAGLGRTGTVAALILMQYGQERTRCAQAGSAQPGRPFSRWSRSTIYR